jgi:uncharacterized surface protein with fasciclin (FAS1) repeats
MNNNMMSRPIAFATLALMTLALASCSDFDDYNKAYTGETSSSKLTLWENISQNSTLKNFTALVKKAGFDDELQSSHFYTVWAPADGTFNYDSIAALDSATIMDRFIKCHVANYSYNVSGALENEKVHTLNGKMFYFNGSSDHLSYDDKSLTQVNQACVNGIYNVINGAAEFHPNIYEYLYTVQNADSMLAYCKHYEVSYLDERNSIVGPIVNGRQTYIDSVFVTTNTLFSRIRAYVSKEDSNYTLMVPTTNAWTVAYNMIKPYFKYINKTQSPDLGGITATTKTCTINSKLYIDSLTKKSIMQNLAINNNLGPNRWVFNPDTVNTDTIVTTTGQKLSGANNLLSHTLSNTKMSNGYVRVLDSIAVHPWDSWCYDITVPATYSAYRPKVKSATISTVRLNELELDTTKGHSLYSYADVIPASSSSNPEVDFYLPNVMSTAYNIYCVFVPANVRLGSTAVAKPNKVKFTLNYCDARGSMQKKDFGTKYNDATKIDTMLVGQFTFPVCYYGLGKYYPNFSVTSNMFTLFGTDKYKYDNELRIAAVLLKPVEHEEYIEKMK